MPAERYYGLPAAKVAERLAALVEREATASYARMKTINAADLSPSERERYGFSPGFPREKHPGIRSKRVVRRKP